MAEAVFKSLLGEDGHVSFDLFKVWFDHMNRPALAVAPPPPPQDVSPARESSAKKKRRVVQDDDEFQVDEEDDEIRAPKKAKAPKAATASSKGMTKAVRSARLKSVISSLKTNLKTHKFYAWPNNRAVDCNAELSLSPEEFAELFSAAGTLIPSEKKTSKVTRMEFSSEALTALFGTPKISAPTYSLPRAFAKQKKMGSESISLITAKVDFSQNLNKAKFVFTCKNGAASLWTARSSDDF